MSNKITIEQAKQQINEGFSSIMTREDVLHLLDCIEIHTESQFALTKEQITELAADITNELSGAGMDIVDDYELTMTYKEIEMDNIEFNSHSIEVLVKNTVSDFYQTMNDK